MDYILWDFVPDSMHAYTWGVRTNTAFFLFEIILGLMQEFVVVCAHALWVIYVINHPGV